MRILYLSLSYMPSQRASSVQVMKMCAAFARRGHDVHLVAKRGQGPEIDDHAYYCVDPTFKITKIARPKPRGGGLVYAAGMAALVARHRKWAEIVYCRDPIGALLAAELGLPLAFESHGVPAGRPLRALIARAVKARSAVGLVAISEMLRRDLYDVDIAPTRRPIVVAHDACDPPTRDIVVRQREPPIVGYVGSLYPGRGIELVVKLAEAMPRVTFRVVGGSDADLDRWRRSSASLTNIEWLGFRPQVELPAHYADMDVVLMPYAKSGVVGPRGMLDTARWASPMKMFEYMASGVPIISSDLPVLREVLHDGENAILVPPEDVTAWRGAIERVLGDAKLRYSLAHAAHEDLVRHYTWDARAASVMRGLGLES